jgi:UDPglucose 6-dehydrogenase
MSRGGVAPGDRVERLVRSVAADADFAVVSNPEFLREGAAIDDFMHPDRVVIGSADPRAAEAMRELYRPICGDDVPFLVLRRRSAELAKYAANAFLATKITFINEVANLCEQIDGDIGEVAQAIGLDRRIGPDFLRAGPGYGGSCFPKDTLAYMRTSQDYGAPQRIVEAVIAVNGERKRAMGRRVIRALDGGVHDRTIAMLGLTFKANTDDMRDSPAIDIVQAIQDGGGHVRAYDPQGMTHATYLMSGVTFCQSADEALRGSDAAVVATDWDDFRSLDLAVMKERLTTGIVVDLRNIYDPETMRAAGLNYTSVGR